MKTYIYFIQASNTGLIKIGVSQNPQKRIANIRRNIDQELKILAIIDETDSISEKGLHNKFSDLRVKGESFNPENQLIEFINSTIKIPRHEKRWNEIISIEPRIMSLFLEAKSYESLAKKERKFCANNIWYGYDLPKEKLLDRSVFTANEFLENKPKKKHSDKKYKSMKDQLCELVGWESEIPSLNNSYDYDICYDKIYDALPNCRHNGLC